MPATDEQPSPVASTWADAARRSGARVGRASLLALAIGGITCLGPWLTHPGHSEAQTPTPTPERPAPRETAPAFVMQPWQTASEAAGAKGAYIENGNWSRAADNVWPSTFYFSGLGGQSCISTAVGPRAVLTAAHCVADGAVGEIRMYGWTSNATCRRFPPYQGYPFPGFDVIPAVGPASPTPAAPDPSADFALCKPEGMLLCRASVDSCAPPGGGLFERVHNAYDDLQAPGPGPIRVQGWGCTTLLGVTNYNTLYLTSASIADLPDVTHSYYTTTGEISLCNGDSGGGAYIGDDTSRRLFAVNSSVAAEISNLATTSYGSFVAWATLWGAGEGAWICGLHTEAEGCRP